MRQYVKSKRRRHPGPSHPQPPGSRGSEKHAPGRKQLGTIFKAKLIRRKTLWHREAEVIQKEWSQKLADFMRLPFLSARILKVHMDALLLTLSSHAAEFPLSKNRVGMERIETVLWIAGQLESIAEAAEAMVAPQEVMKP